MLLDKGIFLLDIEVELSWGIMTAPGYNEASIEKARWGSKRERMLLDDILAVLEKHGVPVTWDLLGHAILNSCGSGFHSKFPHPDMPRPSYRWMKKDWYWFDPCKSLDEEPALYGKDITDKIVDFTSRSAVEHDVACHSFSHMIFGDEGCTEAVAEAEVRRCVRLLNENYSINPEVFIFPHNICGHLNVLRRNGFKAFRGPLPLAVNYQEYGGGLANSLSKASSLAIQFASYYFKTSPPLVTPTEEDGLVNIPASMCYSKPSFIPLGLVVAKARKGIQEAVRTKRIFHLFTHDINFGIAEDAQGFLEGFEQVLDLAHAMSEKGELELTTMKSIARNRLGEH